MMDNKLDMTLGDGPIPAHTAHNTDSMSAAEIHQLVNNSIKSALTSAMAVMNDNISKSISLAVSQSRNDTAVVSAGPPSTATVPSPVSEPQKSGKSERKRHHCSDAMTSPTPLLTVGDGQNISGGPSHSGANPKSGLRPSSREDDYDVRATRSAKRSKPDSYIDESEVESEADYEVSLPSSIEGDEEEVGDMEECDPTGSATATGNPHAILDSLGVPFFDPDDIKHPRSGEWSPLPQVAKYVEAWLRKPLDRSNRSKLRSECPRPSVANKVAATPELDPILIKYLLKSGNNPKKGPDRSFMSVQDKLLDILGPLTKILNMAEHAVATGGLVDAGVLRNWALRDTCLLGNANSAMSAERRRSILMRLDPQLTHLATEEPGPSAEGLLFGDSLIKNINKFVGLFSSLDKAQSSLKKSAKVFGKAGRGKGRPSGRGAYFRPYARPTVQYVQDRPQPQVVPAPVPTNPFYPTRGRPWRAHGTSRGFSRGRNTGN
ncbi:uncharacterized protein LOC130284924 [Hyla sarda]|uniref:uncharacterized protein LOC130284924 n=1 Tax=Hyla sarda TaxID=327740 RepID=UPI0024C2BD01|nr:uncharacterized protein LOC130284924 [Hyla sarda]